MTRKPLPIALVLLLLSALVGCGGSSPFGKPSVGGAMRGVGGATVAVSWPVRSRLVPVAANSVIVTFLQGGSAVATATISRPSLGTSGTATFTGLPVGMLTVRAQAFPTLQGAGTAQASATQSVTIVSGITAPVSITMASTIDHLVVNPALPAVVAGSTTTVTATAVDASGATVLTTGTITFATSDSTIGTVDTAGLFSGVAEGVVTVTATESESGKSAGASITVQPTAPGALRPNAIYFGNWNDRGVVSSVFPDGTGRQDTAGGNSNVVASVPDPDHTGSIMFAATVGGQCGIYRGTTLDPATAVVLVPPAYDLITAMQTSANGGLVYVASVGADSFLFRLTNGSPQKLDVADSAAVTLDGTKIAYSKDINGYDQLYVWDVASSTSTLVASDGNSVYPAFSMDGRWIIFSCDADPADGNSWDLYKVSSSGGAPQRLTSTASVDELGSCFDSTGTRFAYFGLGADPATTGIYVFSGGSSTQIVTDSDVSFGVYWTNSVGRSAAVRGPRYQRIVPPKHHLRPNGNR